MSEGSRRRLAAIMFADMVGYTAIMQENEDEARRGRARFRSALDASVEEYHGEILQHYGDGTLCVFGSAVEAVGAAVAIQQELRREPSVPVRIGVHSGDIVHDADGVYGDGVNVASRIESLSAPGGVLVSGKVYDEIKNHATLSVTSMGEVALKNVKRPLKVFAISNEGLHVPTPEEVRAKAWSGEGASRQQDAAAGQGEGGHQGDGPSPGAGERLLEAIRERSLVQWLLLYLVGSWALLQAGSWGTAVLGWPALVQRGLLVVVAVGLPVTLVVTWYHGERGRQRITGPEVAMIAVLLALAGGILTALERGAGPGEAGTPTLRPVGVAQTPPSIAVLPFSNMSGTPETEPFAIGIHDDVLTQLSKIAGLKVISRTSVLGYRGSDKGIPQIARELGVGAVLEGGVQRAGDRIRINAQLIHAETDAHLWAETFDTVYTVENVFAIQSAIATAIAGALEAVLTQEERAGIDDVPTDDIAAYELYLRGLENLNRPGWDIRNLTRAQEDFEGAAAIDPDFALAYAHLSAVHFLFVRVAYDTSTERVEAIRESAERALAIDPDLPQGHQGLSHYLYLTGQVDRALTELAIAGRGLPSDPWVPVSQGSIRQRQGAWDQAIRDFERAVGLDPRNPELVFLLGDTYARLRRWPEAERQFDRALAIAPGLQPAELLKAMLAIDRDGSARPLLEFFERVGPEQDPLGQGTFMRWWAHFLVRDFEGADAVLAGFPGSPAGWQVQYPVPVLRALSLRAAGRPEQARRLLEEGLPAVEQTARERADLPGAQAGLGLAYALLGRSDDAVRAGLRAVELAPISQDAYFGPAYLSDLARIYTLVGALDLAIDQLETLLSIPGELSVNEIRLDPMWDPLRDVPRFQALVETAQARP